MKFPALRLPRHRGGAHAPLDHLVGQGMRLRNGCRVGHAGEPQRLKVLRPHIGTGAVPQRTVEGAAKACLIEVAAHTRDIRKVDSPLHAQRPERAEDSAVDRRLTVERGGHRTEHLLHMARCGGRSCGESHHNRVCRVVDHLAGLLAQRGVGLVAHQQGHRLPIGLIYMAECRLIRTDGHSGGPDARHPIHPELEAGEERLQRGGGLLSQVAAGNENEC